MSHFHNRYCHIILHILSSLLPASRVAGTVAVVTRVDVVAVVTGVDV